eukprot:3413484-Rhodomonas_salina.3
MSPPLYDKIEVCDALVPKVCGSAPCPEHAQATDFCQEFHGIMRWPSAEFKANGSVDLDALIAQGLKVTLHPDNGRSSCC